MPLRRAVAAALLLGLVAGACSSGKDGPEAKPGITEQHQAQGDLELDVVAWDQVSQDKPLAPLDDATRAAATKVLQTTFDATVVKPLRTGKPGEIVKVFTEDALVHAVGQDRAALYDEGLPRVREVVADRIEVRLTALDGGAGPAMIVARIDWDVRSADRKVRVQRAGELSLVPFLGTWLVGGYTLFTTRTIGATTTTTTAAVPG